MLRRAACLSGARGYALNLSRGLRPALKFDFTRGSFSQLLTHSRGTLATQIGPTGLVEFAPHNLLQHSEDFTQQLPWQVDASGAGSTAPIIVPAQTAPDGTLTASRVLFDRGSAASGYSRLFQSPSITNTLRHTISVWAKTFDGSTQTIVFRCGADDTVITVTGAWQEFVLNKDPIGSPQTWQLLAWQIYATTQAPDLVIWRSQVNQGAKTAYVASGASQNLGGLRFTHDPLTLAPLGLLIEGQRTNQSQQSHNLSVEPPWFKRGAPGITANAGLAPDGTMTATRIASLGNPGSNDVYQVTASGTGAASPSIWIKKVSASGVLSIANSPGAVGQWQINLASLGTDWERITKAHPAVTELDPWEFAAGGSNGLFLYESSGGGPLDFYAWGGQLEAGAYPTSLIPTGSAAATRAADAASIALGSWFNQAEGTIIVDVYQSPDGHTYPVFLSLWGSSVNDRVDLYAVNGAPNAIVASGGSLTFNAGVPWGVVAAGQRMRIGLAFKANDFAACVNGGVVAVGAGALPATPLVAGHLNQGNGTQHPDTTYRAIEYHPRRLSNSLLQALTLL